jgi:RNA polymerase sigma-70 factor (ECF subfamily)
MPETPNPLLDLNRYRDYLLTLARSEVRDRFPGKLDLSGIVQETLLEAVRSAESFRGTTEAERMAWLRRILAHNLTDEVRKLGAAKRDAGRELSLDAALDDSSARLERWLVGTDLTPSRRLGKEEQLLRMAEALTQLPDAQRDAVELHHLKGLPLAEVAERIGRSKGAVASLVFRGLERLRQLLGDSTAE